MRSWILRSLLLLTLFTCIGAQTEGWRAYRNQDGNFAARMPVEPKENVTGAGAHTIVASSDGVGYIVIYVFNPVEQPVNEATFNVYRDSFLKGLPQCEMTAEGPPLPAIPGHAGHSYRLNCNMDGKKTFVGNLYWGKHYAYAVFDLFPTGSSDPAPERQFLDSFSVIDPEK